MGKPSKRKQQKHLRKKKHQQRKKRPRNPPAAQLDPPQKNRPPEQLDQPKLTPRGEYTLFEHPRKIVEIEFPSQWVHTLDDDTRSVIFHPSDRDNVALSCYVMPITINLEEVIDDPRMEQMCHAFFKEADAVNPRRDTTIPYFCMIADRNQKGLEGHYRLVAACDIFMGVSTYCPKDEVHVWAPVFERMLSTFRIPRETEGLYMKAVQMLCAKLNEAAPEEEYKIAPGYELRGKNRRIPLGNLLARIKSSPDRWEKLVEDFLEKAVTISAAHLGDEDLEDVREEIFPFIRPDSVGEEESALMKNAWLANLAVVYVIRIDSGFRYISEYDLQRWEIDGEELHQIAIANLCQLDTIAQRPELPQLPEETLPFVMVGAGDNMEASRLLNPSLYELFADTFGGPFIAAIPCRDALILLANDKDLRRRVQKIVRWDYERSDYAITDRLFLVTADGVALAEW